VRGRDISFVYKYKVQEMNCLLPDLSVGAANGLSNKKKLTSSFGALHSFALVAAIVMNAVVNWTAFILLIVVVVCYLNVGRLQGSLLN
jgi:hypothetical protein